jgi:hypothetical protein
MKDGVCRHVASSSRAAGRCWSSTTRLWQLPSGLSRAGFRLGRRRCLLPLSVPGESGLHPATGNSGTRKRSLRRSISLPDGDWRSPSGSADKRPIRHGGCSPFPGGKSSKLHWDEIPPLAAGGPPRPAGSCRGILPTNYAIMFSYAAVCVIVNIGIKNPPPIESVEVRLTADDIVLPGDLRIT